MSLKIIESVIKDINGVHKSISDEHFSNRPNAIHLKKFQVKNCITNDKISDEFSEYINDYHAKLNLVIAYSDFEYDYSKFDGRMRVKQKESIQSKLLYYYHHHNHGEIPMRKCLNDMLGFRLVFDNCNFDSKLFIDTMDNLKIESPLMKWYTRDLEGYRGTHIYFNNINNLYFPWELQIWNRIDALGNEKAHAEHKSKRSYINWPRQYKEGLLRKDEE